MRQAAVLGIWGMIGLAPLIVQPARGDVFTLKDGTKIDGEITGKTDAGWTVKTTDGKTLNLASDKVKSVEAKRNEEPMKRLESFRRSIGGATDIPKILERYRKFIDQYVGTPAADEALKDVQVWEQRLSLGMVKVGNTWMTQVELADMRRKGAERAEAARQLLLAGRMRDAMSAIDGAIGEDPQNAAAHYLRGIVLYRQEQPANARKEFDTVAQLTPTHAPTHNNLAVIQWTTKQYPGAINFYGQAMTLAPVTRSILDNVAEALNELPESQRDNAMTEKVVLLFNAQDMVLQKRMKERGLFRWGATWVDEKTLEQLKGEQDRIDDAIDKMEKDFDQVQDRIEGIEHDIKETARAIRRIEANTLSYSDPRTRLRMSYPRQYYDLKRDLEELNEEREAEQDKSSRLKKKAKDIRQSISVPRYTGVQQIIGVEGTPGLEPVANSGRHDGEEDVTATTAPTTQATK